MLLAPSALSVALETGWRGHLPGPRPLTVLWDRPACRRGFRAGDDNFGVLDSYKEGSLPFGLSSLLDDAPGPQLGERPGERRG